MLQNFAWALKTKTLDFFADGNNNDHHGYQCGAIPFAHLDPAGAKQTIPNGSKNPPAALPATPLPSHHHGEQLQRALVSSLFATVSSFHAAYLHLQAAHEPFQLEAISTADRDVISHLHRLSDLRRAYYTFQCSPGDAASCHGLPLSSHLEAEVLENQSTLRKLESFLNQLQVEVDRRDAEASDLKQQLRGIEASNVLSERKLGSLRTCAALDEGEKLLLSVGVFDAVLKEACRAAHEFTKTLIGVLKSSGWDLEAVAKSIYPGADFAKRGHRGYALLSYVCLVMFEGFGSDGFEGDGAETSLCTDDSKLRTEEFLGQFVDHCLDDPTDLLAAKPESEFARFCERKRRLLLHPEAESSLVSGGLHSGDGVLGSWHLSGPIYEQFVSMCSLVWMLHRLAMAFDRAVEVFRVQQGVDFSMVYMENVIVCRKALLPGSDGGRKMRPKVGFTVVPGFRLGATVIQCRVYLNYTRCSS